MRVLAFSLLIIGLSVCSGCDGKGSADGSGPGYGSYGHAKISLPF